MPLLDPDQQPVTPALEWSSFPYNRAARIAHSLHVNHLLAASTLGAPPPTWHDARNLVVPVERDETHWEAARKRRLI